jgi:hypothetical protein
MSLPYPGAGRRLLQRVCGADAIDLKSAGKFVILAKSGIGITGPATATTVDGDIGVSPIAATAITAFALTLTSYADKSYSLSTRVKGKVYADDYGGTTPALMTTAVLDMQNAYTNAANRPNGRLTLLAMYLLYFEAHTNLTIITHR